MTKSNEFCCFECGHFWSKELAGYSGENPVDWCPKCTSMRTNVKQRVEKMKDVPKITHSYHGHPRFYELLNEIADLHSRKNHDYSGDDPLANLRSSEQIGIPAWKGILVRLQDKWSRLQTFAREGKFEVTNESVVDTLMDNAVYSLLCIILLEEAGK